MPKTESPSNSSTGKQPPQPEEYANFKIGDRATIKSTHPLFPSVICTITAKPSPDAAIVELASGNRERILLKYLEQLQQSDTGGLDLALGGTQIVKENLEQEPQQLHPRAGVVEIIEQLSPDEERERHRLELRVSRAFYEAGASLRELRNKRLYRSTHRSFEEYCCSRFGFTRQSANYLIASAGVFENLTTNGCQILPTSERQVRHLTKLEPTVQPKAWQEAIDLANGNVPSSKIVKGIVERMKEKPLFLASDYCEMGEVFFLTST